MLSRRELELQLSDVRGGARWVWAHLHLALGSQGHQEGLCDGCRLSRKMADWAPCLLELRNRWSCHQGSRQRQSGECAGQGIKGGTGVHWPKFEGLLLPQGSLLWPGLYSKGTQLRRLRRRNVLALWLGPERGCWLHMWLGLEDLASAALHPPCSPLTTGPTPLEEDSGVYCCPHCGWSTATLVPEQLRPPNALGAELGPGTCRVLCLLLGCQECRAPSWGTVIRARLL